MQASNGRIRRWPVLSQILNFLSVTDAFAGRVSNLTQEGLAYSMLKISGYFEDGNFVVTDAVVNTSALTLVASGIVELTTGGVELTVLASLGALRPVLSWLPLVANQFGTSLISVPVRVSGTVMAPRVIPLDPSAVASHVVDLLKRTVQLPVKLMAPVLRR